jgi:hypothetical protein
VGRRAGRHRKAGKREKNGRPQRTKPDLKTKTSRQPHRRALSADVRTDERAESAIGRLFLRQQLHNERHPKLPIEAALHVDSDCYDAAQRYAHVVGEYRSTIEGPRSTSGSGRGADCVAEIFGREACRFDPDNCKCFRRKARYDGAFEALHEAGRAALMAVNRVVIQSADPTAEEIVYLVAGLRVLAWHFGLTSRRPARNVRNAN